MADIGAFTLALGGVLAGGGMWSVLRILARGRVAVALERQRAASVAQALERLPPGGAVCELDEGGTFRAITKPAPGD
ncbi:hypothetical protein SMC26_29450 [Actinomadura fulvescens]|uniref:Uncharacterized protein n=1 Tax=Actinomadura fulvescens TaxID=46160 RepID=A0ABN3QK49_9ACTN